MNSRIDDDMLKRLVSYEGYVEKLFCQAAHRRWLEMKSDVVQDYEKLKALKKTFLRWSTWPFSGTGSNTG